VIVDEHVFTDAYLPDRLLHRDAEVNVLADAFEPAVAGDRPADVVIHGPSGVGKTVLARHTFERLQRRAAVEWAHIRSLGKSPAGIARGVLEALGGDPATTTPEDELWRRLRKRVDRPLIVVLDEGDDLHTDALSKLVEIPRLAVVVIVHQPEALLARVDDDRIHQRLVGQELELSRYANTELADILEPRVRHGLTVDVERTYLESIADHVGGVAREGIQTLRAASEIASEEECAVESVAIADAYDRAMQWIRQSNLESLPLHHQVLYELIRETGSVTPEELHQRYEAVSEAVYEDRDRVPIGKRARRNKLRKLDEYGLIEIVGANRHREYRVADEAVSPAMTFDFPERYLV
jgi:Cdc6-like AAA superfamily ATPase